MNRFNIRRSIDAGRPVQENEPEDALSAAKGILLGLVISLGFWALVWWACLNV